MGGGLKIALLQRVEVHTELEDALSAKRTIKTSVLVGTTALTVGQEWTEGQRMLMGDVLLAMCILGLAIVDIMQEWSIRGLEEKIRKMEDRQ